jgi:hypothetical protein
MAVRNLSIEQATELAQDIYENERRSHGSAPTLAYHILTKDENNAEAIYIMMEIIDRLAHGPLSIALGEYIGTIEADEEKKRLFRQSRIRRLISFDILKDPMGDCRSEAATEAELEQFTLDEKRLEDFVQEGLGPTKSLKSSFEAARNLLGLDRGLIKHKKLGFSVPLAELFDSQQFEKTHEFEEFLDSRGYEAPAQTFGSLSNWRLAQHVASAKTIHGLQPITFRLLYHLLKIDEDNAQALKVLSGMAESFAEPAISFTLGEYAYERIQVKWIKARVGACQRLHLRRLGLLTHVSGSETIPSEAWEDPTQFVIDEQGLAALKKEALGATRTLRSIFEAVRTSIGIRAGLIRHKTLATSIPFAELCQSDKFEETDEYAKFLSSDKFDAEPNQPDPALEPLTVKTGLIIKAT